MLQYRPCISPGYNEHFQLTTLLEGRATPILRRPFTPLQRALTGDNVNGLGKHSIRHMRPFIFLQSLIRRIVLPELLMEEAKFHNIIRSLSLSSQ